VALAPPPTPRVVLAQALLKGDHWADCVNLGTQAGVAAFRPLLTRRAVVREVRPERLRRWREVAREAAEQCGRADVPEILEPVAVEALAAADGWVAVLAPAAPSLERVWTEQGRPDRVTLVAGPEGGLDPQEEETLMQAGAVRGSLGPRILRAENAGPLAAFLLTRLGAR
jgi:16S rRNA (uracil1498-N3)-methyltransferase